MIKVQRVLERRRTEANRRGHVTVGTVLGRRQVVCYLAGTDHTVMTLRTVTAYTGMAKRRIGKTGGVMAIGTVLAVGTGRYVIREFAHTDPVIVARVATTTDTGMIIGARAEGAGSMTITAILVTGRTRIVRIGWHVRIERC